MIHYLLLEDFIPSPRRRTREWHRLVDNSLEEARQRAAMIMGSYPKDGRVLLGLLFQADDAIPVNVRTALHQRETNLHEEVEDKCKIARRALYEELRAEFDGIGEPANVERCAA